MSKKKPGSTETVSSEEPRPRFAPIDPSSLGCDFDPDGPIPPQAGLFGLDTPPEESLVHILPVPFEVTVSYRRGTSLAPIAIRKASHQLDLFDRHLGRPYEQGISLLPELPKIRRLNSAGVHLVDEFHETNPASGDEMELRRMIHSIDRTCEDLHDLIAEETRRSLVGGHLVGLLGGDHSTAFGSILAHAEMFPGMGILSFDAHHDLRPAYEGLTWSHASIFYNVLEKIEGVERIVQVGVRDFAESEANLVEERPDRLRCYYDRDLARSLENGIPLRELAKTIVADLPRKVYVSFDIDGLNPHLCPHTGTPVPGGLEFNQALCILEEVIASGRQIVGFDLVEVAPGSDEWDASVGARILYKLIGFARANHG